MDEMIRKLQDWTRRQAGRGPIHHIDSTMALDTLVYSGGGSSIICIGCGKTLVREVLDPDSEELRSAKDLVSCVVCHH